MQVRKTLNIDKPRLDNQPKPVSTLTRFLLRDSQLVNEVIAAFCCLSLLDFAPIEVPERTNCRNNTATTGPCP